MPLNLSRRSARISVEKNCELSDSDRALIIELLMNFEETPESKIFDNEEFGYWEVPVLRPKARQRRQHRV